MQPWAVLWAVLWLVLGQGEEGEEEGAGRLGGGGEGVRRAAARQE